MAQRTEPYTGLKSNPSHEAPAITPPPQVQFSTKRPRPHGPAASGAIFCFLFVGLDKKEGAWRGATRRSSGYEKNLQDRRVPARQPASFSLNRKENEAKETLFMFRCQRQCFVVEGGSQMNHIIPVAVARKADRPRLALLTRVINGSDAGFHGKGCRGLTVKAFNLCCPKN